MSDFKRLEWLREKVAQGLSLQDDPQLFDQLLEEHSKHSAIVGFLDGGGGATGSANIWSRGSAGTDNLLTADDSTSSLLFSVEKVTVQVEELREVPR